MLGEFELTGMIVLGNEVDPREALMLVHVAAGADEVWVVVAAGALVVTVTMIVVG